MRSHKREVTGRHIRYLRSPSRTVWPPLTYRAPHKVATAWWRKLQRDVSPWHACTVSTCLNTLCRLTVYEAAILKNLLTPELTCVTQQVNYAIRKPYINQGYITIYDRKKVLIITNTSCFTSLGWLNSNKS